MTKILRALSALILFTLVPSLALAAMSSTDILSQVNAARASVGVSPLVINTKLATAAQIKAEDMATRNYFAHNSPEGKTPWDLLAQVGYDWSWAGENLALSTDVNNVNSIVTTWLNSPAHRAIMLDGRYTETGIGVALGTYQGQPAVYIAEEFGLPKTTTSTSVPVTQVPISSTPVSSTVTTTNPATVTTTTVTTPTTGTVTTPSRAIATVTASGVTTYTYPMISTTGKVTKSKVKAKVIKKVVKTAKNKKLSQMTRAVTITSLKRS